MSERAIEAASEPVNVACIRVIAEKYREAEAPFKEAGDPKGLGIGACAVVLENAADEIERLRAALAAADRGPSPELLELKRLLELHMPAAAGRVAGETQIGELLRVIEKRDREHNLFNCPSGGWIRRQLKAALASPPGKVEGWREEREEYREVLQSIVDHKPGTPGLHYDSLESLINSATAIARQVLDRFPSPPISSRAEDS